MKITEAIAASHASKVRDQQGAELDVDELLKRYDTQGDDLHKHRLNPAGVLEVEGKKFICRMDSRGVMRRDRWIYEVVANGRAPTTQEPKKEETVMKTKQETKTASTSTRAKKPMTLIRDMLKKKDNNQGRHPCICGCGENCVRLFKQGHDAKLKSQVLAFVREEGPKPSTVSLKAVQEYLAIAPWMTSELKKAVLN